MLSKEEIEFCSSLEKMFNYLKNKKELTEFEKLVMINFDYITKKVLSPECKTATEIVSKNMYYELIKRKEEYYEKQIDQLESDNYEQNNIINSYIEREQKLIEKLEEDIREETGYAKWVNANTKRISPAVTTMISKSQYAKEILEILK